MLLLLTTEKLEIHMDQITDGTTLSKTEVMKYAKLIGCKLKDKAFLYLTLMTDANRESVMNKSGRKSSRK